MRAAGTPGECGGHAYREALGALLPSKILRSRGIVELGTAHWSGGSFDGGNLFGRGGLPRVCVVVRQLGHVSMDNATKM